MNARFEGWCRRCAGRIVQGDPVCRDDDGRWAHIRCVTERGRSNFERAVSKMAAGVVLARLEALGVTVRVDERARKLHFNGEEHIEPDLLEHVYSYRNEIGELLLERERRRAVEIAKLARSRTCSKRYVGTPERALAARCKSCGATGAEHERGTS